MTRTIKVMFTALIFVFILNVFNVGTAEAALDGFSETGGGLETTDSFKENSDIMKGMTDGVGIDTESAQKSKQVFSPIAKLLNIVIGILTLVISIGLIIVSLCDLIYMLIPFLRPVLHNPNRSMNFVTNYPVLFVNQYEGAPQGGMQQQGGMQGGMGGMQGGMGMGGMGRPPMGGMPMGGMGGMQGGMGMGGMQGQQQQQDKPKIKGVVLPYLIYRTKELIIAGVCLAIFTGTMLTDIGIKLVSFIPGL